MESFPYQGLTFHHFDKHLQNLQLTTEVFLPPNESAVPVAVKYASVHPSDFGRIGGSYGKLPSLPAVAGREATGILQADVTLPDGQSLRAGDPVLILTERGAWQSVAHVSPSEIIPLPRELSLQTACLAGGINGATAWAILENFAVSPGDWIMQNAANSSLGVLLSQFSRHRGMHCLHLVRRAAVREQMMVSGFSPVFLDEEDDFRNLQDFLKDKNAPLAINTVGGKSAERLCKLVSNNGKVLTLGAMSREPVYFPTRHLIFRNISLEGFWLDAWLDKLDTRAYYAFWKQLHATLLTNEITLPAPYLFCLSDYEEAIAQAQQPRWGKVLFAFN